MYACTDAQVGGSTHVYCMYAYTDAQVGVSEYQQTLARVADTRVARDFIRGYIDRLGSCFFVGDPLFKCLDIGAGEDFLLLLAHEPRSLSMRTYGCWTNRSSLSSMSPHIRAYA